MDTEAFILHVAAMRELQREFFRTKPHDRKPDLIGRAKAAERQVDAFLDRMKQGQMGLFDGEARS